MQSCWASAETTSALANQESAAQLLLPLCPNA